MPNTGKVKLPYGGLGERKETDITAKFFQSSKGSRSVCGTGSRSDLVTCELETGETEYREKGSA